MTKFLMLFFLFSLMACSSSPHISSEDSTEFKSELFELSVGKRLFHHEEIISFIQLKALKNIPLTVLSNAAYKGGHQKAKSILNLWPHSSDYKYTEGEPFNPTDTIVEKINFHSLEKNSTVALTTSADLRDAIWSEKKIDGISYGVLISYAIGNSAYPGQEGLGDFDARVGTINILVILDTNLSESARVGLIADIAEAKSYAVTQLKVKSTPDYKKLASGTTSDAIALATTNAGKMIQFNGHSTIVTKTLGRMITTSLQKAHTNYCLRINSEEFKKRLTSPSAYTPNYHSCK